MELGKNIVDGMSTSDHAQDLSSEDEGVDDEDMELDECVRGLASIMSKRNPLGKSWGREVPPVCRGRGRHIYRDKVIVRWLDFSGTPEGWVKIQKRILLEMQLMITSYISWVYRKQRKALSLLLT